MVIDAGDLVFCTEVKVSFKCQIDRCIWSSLKHQVLESWSAMRSAWQGLVTDTLKAVGKRDN